MWGLQLPWVHRLLKQVMCPNLSLLFEECVENDGEVQHGDSYWLTDTTFHKQHLLVVS